MKHVTTQPHFYLFFIFPQHVFKGTVKDFIQKVAEVFEVVLWNEGDIMDTDHMVDRTSHGKYN